MPHLTNESDSNQKLGIWGLAGVKVRKTPLDSVPVEDSDQPFPMVWCAGMKCSQRCWHKATLRWPPHASLGVWHILDLASHDREALPVGTLSLVSPLLHPVLTAGPSEVLLATHWLFLPTQTYRAELQTLCSLPSGNMETVLNANNLPFSFQLPKSEQNVALGCKMRSPGGCVTEHLDRDLQVTPGRGTERI